VPIGIDSENIASFRVTLSTFFEIRPDERINNMISALQQENLKSHFNTSYIIYAAVERYVLNLVQVGMARSIMDMCMLSGRQRRKTCWRYKFKKKIFLEMRHLFRSLCAKFKVDQDL
jgi:hypothetical protein